MLYVDVFILQNVLINCLLINTALYITGVKVVVWRVIAASVLGGLYALFILLSSNMLGRLLIVKILIMLVMIKIAVPLKNATIYFKVVIFFLVMTFIFAGVIELIKPSVNNQMLVNDYFIVTNMSIWHIIIVIPILLLLKWAYRYYLTFSEWHSSAIVTVQATFGSHKILVDTALDTGNNLQDTYSGHPIIVVDQAILLEEGHCLLYQLVDSFSEYSVLEPELETLWQRYGRIIPYKSVGTDFDMLLALKPDEIAYFYNNKQCKGKQALIAFTSKSFFNNSRVRGLLHPAVYESIVTEAKEVS